MCLVTLEGKHTSIIYVLAKTVMARKHVLTCFKPRDKTVKQDYFDQQTYPLKLERIDGFLQ